MRYLAITGADRYPHPDVILDALDAWLGDSDPAHCLLLHGPGQELIEAWAGGVGVAVVDSALLGALISALDADAFAFWDGSPEPQTVREWAGLGLELRLWGPEGTEMIG